MRVAINVSGYQMRQDDIAARLERGLRSHGLQAERFTCEITKSVAMEDTVVAHRAFARLGRPRWRRLSALPFSKTPCRWPPATQRHK